MRRGRRWRAPTPEQDRAERNADEHPGRQVDRRLADQRRGVEPGRVDARRCDEHTRGDDADADDVGFSRLRSVLVPS
jgi:hypothetical protein